MKNILITENDRNEILNQYRIGSIKNKEIISEHQRISELMGVKPKTLLLENGGGKYTWITDMPLFRGWKGIIDETPGVIQKLESNMDEISDALHKKGITPDNIKQKAQEWFTNYTKKLNIPKGLSEGEITELYIKTEIPEALNELNSKLTTLTKQGAEIEVDRILRDMETDPDFSLRDQDATGQNSKSLANKKLNETELDEAAVDGVIENTNSAKNHFQKRVSETQSEIDAMRQKAKDMGRELSQQELAAIERLKAVKEKYQKLAENLETKSRRYQTWKDVNAKMPDEAGKVTYMGKVYDMSKMNVFQRVWWKGWLSRTLPLEFFNILGRLIYMAFARQTFVDSFMGNIAAMTNALRNRASIGTQIGLDLALKSQSELEAYAGKLYSELIASIGKPIDKPLTFKDFFKDGVGIPGFKSQEMDVQEAFNRLENMISSVEGVSELEKKQIMQYLFNRYMTNTNKVATPVAELGNWRGWIYFNEDLASLGVKSSLKGDADAAAKAAAEGVSDNKGKFFDFLGDWAYGSAAVRNWKTLIGNMAKKFVNGILLGIPAGLKFVMRPILKRGLGWKSAAAVMTRLYLTKVAFVTVYGGIKAVVFLLAYLQEWTKITDITGLSGKDYANEIGNEYLNDIKEVALSFPWHGIDIGWEKEQSSVPNKPGMEKYNAKFGIFQSYGVEFVRTWYNEIYGKENIDVDKHHKDLEREGLLELNAWVDTEAENVFKNMTPEDKEKIKEASGFNTIRDVSTPGGKFTKKMGYTDSQAENIQKRLFFKSLYVGNIENIRAFKNIQEFRKSGKPITTKDIGGFAFLCEKELEEDRNGDVVCNSKKTYRVVPCNDLYFAQDENFKKYIYNKDTGQDGTKASEYKGKLVYIKNEAMKDKYSLTLGNNLENIGLVTELPFI